MHPSNGFVTFFFCLAFDLIFFFTCIWFTYITKTIKQITRVFINFSENHRQSIVSFKGIKCLNVFVDLSSRGFVSSHNLIGQRLSDTYWLMANHCSVPHTRFRVFDTHESSAACPSARAPKSRNSRHNLTLVVSEQRRTVFTFYLLIIYYCSDNWFGLTARQETFGKS